MKRGKSWIVVKPNGLKTHPASRHLKPSGHICRSLHAEESALMAAIPGDSLIVLRFRFDGSLAMAKPCADCQRAIDAAGIKRVWFSNERGLMERMYT